MPAGIVKNDRDYRLDAIKGLAIVLVITGHIIAFSQPETYTRSILFSLIYAFHMPLFFFVSGYLVFGRFGPSAPVWLKKKFMQLVVPYILFTLFYVFILFGFTRNALSPGSVLQALFSYTKPDSAWFLPVLFESFVILALLILAERAIGKFSYLVFFMVASCIIPLTSLDGIMGVHQIVFYTPFVILGYLACSGKDRFSPYITFLGILGSVLFAVMFIIQSASLLPTINSGLFYLYYAYILALAGIILSWSAVTLIYNRNMAKPFIFCGIFTMEIYLTHLIILNYFTYLHLPLWIGSGIVAIASGSLTLLFLSLLVTFMLSYNKRVSTVIFGRWSYPLFLKIKTDIFRKR